MLGASPGLVDAIARGATVKSGLRVLAEDDTPLLELTGKMVDANVTADNAAANLRNSTMTVSGGDDDDIPESFASTLGPTSRVQLLRGARVENIVTVGELCNTQEAWNNITTPVGQLVGVVANANGELVLGP